MTRSSTKELLNPEQKFRLRRRLFDTPSLVESNSTKFDHISDIEEQSGEEVSKTMTETMEQYMSKTRGDYGSGVTRPTINQDTHFELKGQFLKELRDNTLSGSEHEDANEHIEKRGLPAGIHGLFSGWYYGLASRKVTLGVSMAWAKGVTTGTLFPAVKGWMVEDLDNYHLKELRCSTQCHTQKTMWIIARGDEFTRRKILLGVHDTFHVSNLKKCLADASLHVALDEIKVDKTLCFVEEPVEIMDREVKSLKHSRISLVKVCWNSKRRPKFTWEREDYMKSKYHQLFDERADESAS
ncbi:hypothetical protein Tco_0088508 [Tanacetum coccineum]